MSSISLEEAKSLINNDSLSKLKDVVYAKPTVDIHQKANCDILMSALCKAVADGVIRQSSLDDRIIKLLNASTATLAARKLKDILVQVRDTQPHMVCIITLKTGGLQPETVAEWMFDGSTEISFVGIFGYVVDKFNITPQSVRSKLSEMLKGTIVNNVAQLVAKYNNSTDEERSALNISISTVTRLVNMSEHLLYAEFVEVKE